MEIIETILTVIVGKQAQFIGFLFFVLIIFITADIVTGWLRSWHTGELDSAKNFKGYIRKGTIIVLGLLGVVLDLIVAVTLMFLQMDNIVVFEIGRASCRERV